MHGESNNFDSVFICGFRKTFELDALLPSNVTRKLLDNTEKLCKGVATPNVSPSPFSPKGILTYLARKHLYKMHICCTF